MTQEISQIENNGKVSEQKLKDDHFSLDMVDNPRFILDDTQIQLYNPQRFEIMRYGGTGTFMMKIGGEYYNAKITIGFSRSQLEQVKKVVNEALSWSE